MECGDSTKAVVQILPPHWEEIFFGSPPIEVEVFERAPRWQINYSYEFDNGGGWRGYSYYAEGWGEEGEVNLRFESSPGGFRIYQHSRPLQSDGLLGETQEFLIEDYEGQNRLGRNFQIDAKFQGIYRAWKLVISDVSGPTIHRWYEQEPTYKIICGCKSDECEIPCSRKPEGFCCLSKSKIEFIRRKLRESKPWYQL